MSNSDSAVLTALSQECYFQLRPQPLIDLLNQLGVVGRAAEVFWIYHQLGMQAGTYKCQISSGAIASRLYTDIRTVQRANDRLVTLGLIRRTRAKRRFIANESEAPAITEITIPNDEVREALLCAPRRGKSGPVTSADLSEAPAVNRSSQKPEEPVTAPPFKPAHPGGTVDAPEPDKFTAVNKPETDRSNKAALPVNSLGYALNQLPEGLRRIYDLAALRGKSSLFKAAAQNYSDLPDEVVSLIVDHLDGIEADRITAVAEATQRDPVRPGSAISNRRTKQKSSVNKSDDRRTIPERALAYLQGRLKELTRSTSENGDPELLPEAIYSLSIGTMREVDLMKGIHAVLKLIRHGRWTTPKGMPWGWQWQDVVV